MVEEAALAKAEDDCLADDEARARRRERDAERRAAHDVDLQARMAAEILQLFPGCSPERADSIARHAAERGSGRVGRSAAGRALDVGALELAVAASVRHEDTPYDDLLMSGVDRDEARDRVRDQVRRVLDDWRRPKLIWRLPWGEGAVPDERDVSRDASSTSSAWSVCLPRGRFEGRLRERYLGWDVGRVGAQPRHPKPIARPGDAVQAALRALRIKQCAAYDSQAGRCLTAAVGRATPGTPNGVAVARSYSRPVCAKNVRTPFSDAALQIGVGYRLSRPSTRRRAVVDPNRNGIAASAVSPMRHLLHWLVMLRYVTTIRVMSETMSLAAVKARFSELIDRVERQQDRVIVTRNGKPAAVLISTEDLKASKRPSP